MTSLAVSPANQSESHGLSASEDFSFIMYKFLYPAIQEGVSNYYHEYLSGYPRVDVTSVIIKNVSKVDQKNEYIVQAELLPFFGPHNTIGKDLITIRVVNGKPLLDKFVHLESYDIPDDYKKYVIKWPLK